MFMPVSVVDVPLLFLGHFQDVFMLSRFSRSIQEGRLLSGGRDGGKQRHRSLKGKSGRDAEIPVDYFWPSYVNRKSIRVNEKMHQRCDNNMRYDHVGYAVLAIRGLSTIT
jgi:hypothetical protein